MADRGLATRVELPGTADAEAVLAMYQRLAAGVTVVTAAGPDGPTGCTATAVTSVSLDPPLLLACLSRGSRTLAVIRAMAFFGVHLLSEDQRPSARAFAERGTGPGAKFAGVSWELRHGVPVLTDSLAWAVCRLACAQPMGDHELVVGQLVQTHVTDRMPLLWHGRRFWRLAASAGDTVATVA
jgi:flavin reductase (DIM6/NTAB) family NADH-FMN oxidoreductase RutF